MANLIHQYFNIETGFQGTLVNSFAKLNLDSVIDDVNEETLDPWAELQAKASIQPGPISPFMEPEILKDNALSMDGAKFEREFGLCGGCALDKYKDSVTEEILQKCEQVDAVFFSRVMSSLSRLLCSRRPCSSFSTSKHS